MTTTAIAVRTGVLAAFVALALPLQAQTNAGSGQAGNVGARTPSADPEVSPGGAGTRGRSTTSIVPNNLPRGVNESGPNRPEVVRTTPPPGSETMANPRPPLSINESGETREQQRGGTSGAVGSGTAR